MGCGRVWGFVTGIGRRWVAIAILDDGKRPDGWELLRLKDIERVRLNKDADAVAIRVLRARGDWPLAAPPIPLDKTRDLLRAAGTDLMSVHIERKRPDAYWVGSPLDISESEVDLASLDSEARWEEKILVFELRDITRVTTSNAYVAALGLVAGPRPDQAPD